MKLSTPVKRITEEEAEQLAGLETAVSHAVYLDRPYYSNKWDFLRRSPVIVVPTLWKLFKAIQAEDIVIIRLPMPIGVLAYGIARLLRKPVYLYIAGDLKTRNRRLPGDNSPKALVREWLAQAYSAG